MKLKHKALISLAVIAFILIPVVASFAGDANYIYDNNNRLIRVEYGDGRVVEYVYDDVGNLLQRVPTGPIISVTPASYDFGSVNVGGISSPAAFTIINAGTDNLSIGTIAITGSDASEFSIQSDNCQGRYYHHPTVQFRQFFHPQNPGSYRLYVSGTAYSTGGWQTSDIRYKENIAPIESPLNKILNINGVLFNWKTEEYKDKGFPEGRHYGVIAQEIENICGKC